MQPSLKALIDELDLATFPQHSDGDVIFQRMSRETPRRYRATQQEPQSMRIVGGTGILIKTLAKDVPRERILLSTLVESIELRPTCVTLNISGRDGAQASVDAEQVIAAVPPRLLANLSFTPPMDLAVEQRWRATPTWMAPHAKFFAIYDRPFWREAGLSGTAQSFSGPLAEIHDATTASGKAALFGFPAVNAAVRSAMGESEMKKGCLEQFGRLFGPQALKPRATILKDWAIDPLTAAADDQAAGGHPVGSSEPWVTGAWRERLSLCGSETSATEPGYMAGAVSAAEDAVAEMLKRLNVFVERKR
jgi:monoamine oxidase